MIDSFRCKDMQALVETGRCRRFAAISVVATRKLAQLDAAVTLDFLRSPPGNRLEALRVERNVSNRRRDRGLPSVRGLCRPTE
jgi:proteic killer suppression protein